MGKGTTRNCTGERFVATTVALPWPVAKKLVPYEAMGKAPVKEVRASSVFVFKVALKRRKGVWRRIAIRGDQTLDDLHAAIFAAFDRFDEHLYSFYFFRRGTKGRDRLRDALEFAHPVCLKDQGPFGSEPGLKNAAKTRIDSLKLSKGKEFEYLFDFGDSWWHVVTTESTTGEPDEQRFPRVIESKGKSPAQYPDNDED